MALGKMALGKTALGKTALHEITDKNNEEGRNTQQALPDNDTMPNRALDPCLYTPSPYWPQA